MIKRWIIFIITTVLIFAMFGCSEKEKIHDSGKRAVMNYVYRI